MQARPTSPAWYVISLRPTGGHAGLRRAAGRHGAGLIALSPWRLGVRDDAAVRADLQASLAALRVVFSSPAAVRAAAALADLAGLPGREWFAVGAGTAAALRRAGVGPVRVSRQMDSAGLLALPGLEDVAGQPVGLVTAPGGRERIATTLRERGARILRADVYQREPVPLRPAAVAMLAGLRVPAALALSSGQALARVLEALPPAEATRLTTCLAVAASPRLAALARDHGFGRVVQAPGPMPAQMAATAARALFPAGSALA